MRDINILINEDHTVCFDDDYAGLNGENLQGNIVFKFNNFVNGQARAEVIIDNQDGYILLEKVGETYTMPIKSSLLTSDFIIMQLVIDEVGEGYPIWKSETFTLKVGYSINAETTIPEDYPSWIQVINGLINDTEEAIEKAGNLDINATRNDDGATITITHQDKSTTSVEIYDGEQGEQGETGKTPNIQIGTVETLPTGSSATATITGTIDNPLLNLGIPKGDTGNKGDTGLTPNIQIGSVTSGATPSVTRTGTDENPVLNFVLQKGDTGETGATGATGATGNGISNIVKTSTSGLVDTYTITYTNGTTQTYEVTNGEDGEVTQAQLDEVIAENDYLNSIIDQIVPKTTATGTSITLDDTLQAKMNMELSPSELEQETTTGKNIFSTKSSIWTGSSAGKVTYDSATDLFTFHRDSGADYLIDSGSLNLEENTSYKLTMIITENTMTNNFSLVSTSANLTGTAVISAGETGTKTFSLLTSDVNKTYDMWIYCNSTGTLKAKIMLEKGATATDYEPYTGGTPAPSPDFPMEVHTISGDNTIVVNGKNWANTLTTIQSYPSDTTSSPTTPRKFTRGTYIVGMASNNYYVPNSVTITNHDKDKWTISNTLAGFGVGFPLNLPVGSYKQTRGTGSQGLLAVLKYDSEGNYVSNTTGSTFDIEEGFSYMLVIVSTIANSQITFSETMLLKLAETDLTYTPYQEQTAQVNLGDLEYSKIGNYADVFMKPSGKNKLDINNPTKLNVATTSVSGETITINSTTTVTIPYANWEFSVKENDIIRINGIIKNSNGRIVRQIWNGTSWVNYVSTDYIDGISTSSLEYTVESGISKIRFNLYSNKSLPTGATSSSYENVIVTINNNNMIYEPYNNGKWYLKKNIGKVVLDGSEDESWTYNSGYKGFVFPTTNQDFANRKLDVYIGYCNYFTVNTNSNTWTATNYCGWNSGGAFWFIDNNVFADNTTDLKTYLQSHNIIVMYPLATPTYTLLNDTLQSQLDTIESMLLSYKGQTNISQINNDLPFIMTSTALKEL